MPLHTLLIFAASILVFLAASEIELNTSISLPVKSISITTFFNPLGLSTFLISPEGKIIAGNLNIDEWLEKFQEIFI